MSYSMTASVTEPLGSVVRVSADELLSEMGRCQVCVIKKWQFCYHLRFTSRGICFGGIWSLFSLTFNIGIQNIAEDFKENSIFSSMWLFMLLFCCCFGFYLVFNSFARQGLHCTCFSVSSRG